MPEHSSRWDLDRFLEELDLWVGREQPEVDLVVAVADWIMTRIDEPYRGVRRAEGFDNLWFGHVPESDDGTGRVVTCSYWVFESTRQLRCNSFATLSLPI